jgi:hypothetical protein
MTEVVLQSIINQVQEIITYAENNQLTNTQEFINFLDKLNELSVSH